MSSVKEKMLADLKLKGVGESHSRTVITARDVSMAIDEPEARGGSNTGLTPTESIIASLIGCTTVVVHRLAEREGVSIKGLAVDALAKFDRRGVSLSEEVECPFPEVRLDIRLDSDANPEQRKTLESDLGRFCPISKVLRGSGAKVVESWTHG